MGHQLALNPQQQPEKATSENTPYQAILDAYHDILPEMPNIRELTDSRKTKIRELLDQVQVRRDPLACLLGFHRQRTAAG